MLISEQLIVPSGSSWCYAKLENRAWLSKGPVLYVALAGVHWAGLLPRASYHQLKKLPKPCLTMWDHVWCPTFQTRSVFLDTITILKRRAVWEFHLDNPWPANEFRTAQCLRAMRTGSLSRSREQPRCQVLFLGQTPGTLFQHYIICLDLTQLRCPVPSLPFTAQLCIWYL